MGARRHGWASSALPAALLATLVGAWQEAGAQPCPATLDGHRLFPVLAWPNDVESTDLDGDGNLDIVAACYFGPFSWLMGNGDGTFSAAMTVADTEGGYDVELGDFDGDGRTDAAMARYGFSIVSVLLGTGGSFQLTASLTTLGYPRGLAIADFDGDGRMDLASANRTTGRASVALGNGDGTFQAVLNYVAGPDPTSIGTADINRDGNADLVVGQGSATHFTLMLGVGDGTFQVPTAHDIGASPYWVITPDIDQDGAADVVVSTWWGHEVRVSRGRGDGTFDPPLAFPFPGAAEKIESADLDLDGDTDVAAFWDRSISVLLNDGAGGLVYDADYEACDNCHHGAAGDFNGDGLVDIVAASWSSQDSVSFVLGSGGGRFVDPRRIQAGTRPGSVALADLDLDGALDLAVANAGSNDLWILLGDGAGGFGAPIVTPVAGGLEAIAVGMVDADAIPDVVVTLGQARAVGVLLGTGGGAFGTLRTYGSPNSWSKVALADIVEDGHLDVAVSGASSGIVSIFTGSATGALVNRTDLFLGGGPDFVLRRIDADVHVDLAATGLSGGGVAVMTGGGDGTFQPSTQVAVPGDPRPLVAVDGDADGDLDLVTADGGPSGRIHLVPSNGDGTFQAPILLGQIDGSCDSMVAGDLTGDGYLDLAVANEDESRLALLPGRGASGFGPPLVYNGNDVWVLAAGDLDGDGAEELAAVRPMRGDVILLEGGSFVLGPPALPGGVVATAYAATLSAAGGTPPYTYTLAGGALPPGLWLSSFGALSGTPTYAGAFAFRARATDAAGCASERAYAVTVACPFTITIFPTSLPPATEGAAYAETITASGGSAPYTFDVSSGAPPAGLALSPAGVLSGVPQTPGSSSFEVRATDAVGCMGRRSYVLVVGCPWISISPASLPAATIGVPYGQTLAAGGGRPPYAFAITSGALPPGLSLLGTGVITGVATAAGTSTFEVTATDAGGCPGRRTYTMRVTSTDYLAGAGHGLPNPNRVRAYDGGGAATPVDFLAYGAGAWGVNVASGRATGGVDDTILTGPGPGRVLGPQVRGFDRTGAPLGKINFYAYATLQWGAAVAGAGIDGDPFSEILSGAGPGAVFGPHVRGWNVDGGSVAPISKVSFFAFGTLRYGVGVDDADLDADGYDEILAAAGPGPTFAATVRGYDYDGISLSAISKVNFNAGPLLFGARAAGGDVDGDGYGEIAAAPGPGPVNGARVLGFDYDGQAVAALPGFDGTPFPTMYGASPATGDVEGLQRADLVAGAGPDPAAASAVVAFGYSGSSLYQLAGTPFFPFPGGFGVVPASAALGH